LLLYPVDICGRVQVVLINHPRIALRKPILERINESLSSRVPPDDKANLHTSSTEGLG
jgi:hypothetical protein